MNLDPSQARAVALATTASIACLTGGPGTGKSTTVRAVLDALPKSQIELCSPTGKAAKRLSQTTGREARTLHRLLEYRGSQGFTRGPLFPVDADLVIVEYCADYDAACTACRDAMDDRGEAAEQRAHEAYHGGDGPQTQREQYEAAAAERWQEDRAWMRRV
jgi:ATP-dependent exoDNAse (exonuclease V) alpha subunit